jgi:hypothetical protein
MRVKNGEITMWKEIVKGGRKWETQEDDIVIPKEEWMALQMAIREMDRRRYVLRRMANINKFKALDDETLRQLKMQLDSMDDAMDELNASLEEAHAIEENPNPYVSQKEEGAYWRNKVDQELPDSE